jgi:hypothetical protein
MHSAVGVADADKGLSSLSMRRVADSLNVRHHVAVANHFPYGPIVDLAVSLV